MHKTESLLANKSPFLQLLVLIMMILISVLFTFLIGILVGLPFFGTDILDLLSEASNMGNHEEVALMKYFQVVSQIGMFIIPSIVFSLLVSRQIGKYLSLEKFPNYLSLISAIILIFTILPGINWLAEINQTMTLPDWLGGVENWMRQSEESAARLTEAFLKTETLSGLLLNLFMVAFLAAIGEELLFRGILLRILNNWFNNAHLAIWITAILFSMMHLQFFGFLPRLALGALFGYLLIWSGSLWLPIIAHFLNNAAAVLVYYFYNKEIIDTRVENFGTLNDSLLFIISILISSGLLFMVYFSGKNRQAQNT